MIGWAGTAAASNGKPNSSATNSMAAATDKARGICTAIDTPEGGVCALPSNAQPISAPARIAATWPIAEGTAKARIAAPTAIVAQIFSGLAAAGRRLCAMPHTACATTATATILSPCSQGAPDKSPNRVKP